MIWSERRGRIVDYLGSHQHLAVDIDLEGPVAFEFPMLASGYADALEWWDDAARRHRIEVSVTNPRFGPLFGYRGSFEVDERPVDRARSPPGCGPGARSGASERPPALSAQPPDQSPTGTTPAASTMRIVVRTGARVRCRTPFGTV
jgi:hypothetical protein